MSNKERKASKNQLEIINSTEPRIIVEAGAGAGKTYVLTERIRKLLNDGVEPSNIVAITFTRMAGEELRERLADIPDIGDAFIGTIHAFANKIFKNSGETYNIYSEDVENQFMRVLINSYAKYLTMDKFFVYKDFRKKVELGLEDESKIELILNAGERDELAHFYSKKITDEYPETIQTLCKKNSVITFDELLQKTTEYFKEINGKIEYLFVDEFQDIGPLEKRFFQSLNADNYFYVGDPKQGIYAFKGGDVKYFLNLIKSPKWKTYYLFDNYRCGSSIITIANKVIAQADDIITMKTVCKSGKQGRVILGSKYSVDNYLSDMKDYKDWFILVRTNKDLVTLEEKLNGLGIPFVSFRKSDMTLNEMRNCMAEDKVKLLTIHTSKGLESPNVLMWGNFPIVQKPYLRNNDELKIEYVGMTRAIDKLIILN